MTATPFNVWLEKNQSRFPSGYIEKRQKREQKKSHSNNTGTNHTLSHLLRPQNVAYTMLKFTGLAGIGRKNTANLEVRYNPLLVRGLPEAFSGYRVLQISDPHYHQHSLITKPLLEAVTSTNYDLCVLTGDYRFSASNPIDVAMSSISALKSAIKSNVIAILGNHDSITMLPDMESMGITVLVNESVAVERNNTKMSILGVDDPHYFRLDDLDQAILSSQQHGSACSLLLAHSPEIYKQAQQAQVGAYLCGHTHGGQLCLPNGKALYRNSRSPEWSLAGAWHYQGLHGYTSVGAGVSSIEARFFCRPEVTVHELVALV